MVQLAAAAASADTATVPAKQDSDWPCQQRLVPELAVAQMWNGPAPPDGAMWQSDPAIAPLALELAEKAPADTMSRIDSFAQAQPAETRGPRLALLFGASLEIINGQRSKEIAGIKRYTRNQQALAKKIADESAKLGNLPHGLDVVPPPELAEAKQARDWDIRVFEDRQRSLKYLCDEPVALEQRAFALAQTLEAKIQ